MPLRKSLVCFFFSQLMQCNFSKQFLCEAIRKVANYCQCNCLSSRQIKCLQAFLVYSSRIQFLSFKNKLLKTKVLLLYLLEFSFVTQIVKKLIFNPEGIQKFVFQALAQHWSNKLPGAGGGIWHTTFESLHDYNGQSLICLMEKVFVETNSFSFALFKNSIRLI